MKFLTCTTLCFSLFAATASLSSCDKDDDAPAFGEMSMEFENVVGSSALQLSGTTPYQTAAGDQFTITTFRYYISNIKLRKADGTEFVQPESYYLVDEALAQSKTFTIPNIPIGDYTSLTFTVGVDSVRSVDGASRIGALAPGDMFWSWSTGYIYTKLEGRSPQAANGAIVFHIGGFKKPNNTIRTVSPSLNGNVIQIQNGRTPEVHMKADVLRMFTGPNTIRFATLSNTMGGPNSMLVANNQAAGMFTIDQVHGN